MRRVYVLLLIGCTSCVSVPLNDEHQWRVSRWEESAGIGQGKTNTSHWTHLWDAVSLYQWNAGVWQWGPSLRDFTIMHGRTNDGYYSNNETPSFGAAAHHASTTAAAPSEWTVRLMGERRTEDGENERIGYTSSQTTHLAHWDVSYVLWPTD